MRNFRDYKVWQDAMLLVKKVYALTKAMPVNERYALSDQIHRAVVSIPSNIAEGAGRRTAAEFGRFLDIALGSAYETETQLILIQDLGLLGASDVQSVITDVQSVQKQLTVLIENLSQPQK